MSWKKSLQHRTIWRKKKEADVTAYTYLHRQPGSATWCTYLCMIHYVKRLYIVFLVFLREKWSQQAKQSVIFFSHATTYHVHINTFTPNSFFNNCVFVQCINVLWFLKQSLPDGHLTWFPVLTWLTTQYTYIVVHSFFKTDA